MLAINRLTAGYGAADIVQGVDLTVAQGETVTLLGPNGAGKSTLLAAATGTIRDRAGSIKVGDRELIRADSHRIVDAGVALVPEGRHVFAPMSVADNLRLGAFRLKSAKGHSLSERFDFVYTLFPRLKERSRQASGTLSGGEQQMLAVGRALMSAPHLLLLDEPFLGLAPMIVDEIRQALETLRGDGMTQLIVEQKLDIALGIATRAYVMVKGNIVLESSSEDLLARDNLSDLYFDV